VGLFTVVKLSSCIHLACCPVGFWVYCVSGLYVDLGFGYFYRSSVIPHFFEIIARFVSYIDPIDLGWFTYLLEKQDRGAIK
jgi:hypothetical protein